MRTLKFIVEDQIIRPDPNCDFSGLVPGTSGYLQAEFSFSPEWKDTVKVVGFYSLMGKSYPSQILKDGKTCIIPVEALKKKTFKLNVLGKKGDMVLTTNKVQIKQDGGSV